MLSQLLEIVANWKFYMNFSIAQRVTKPAPATANPYLLEGKRRLPNPPSITASAAAPAVYFQRTLRSSAR